LFALPRLLAKGFKVIAVSRRGRPGWYPRFGGVTWLDQEGLDHAGLRSVNMLLSAGPIRLAAESVQACPGLERAAIFSTSSVFSKLDSHDRSEKECMQHILAQEAELTTNCEARDVALSVLRPTLVYGCGLDGNVSWLAAWIRRFGFLPVAGAAGGLRQPVHADDLAAAATAALTTAGPVSLDTPLCGDSTLSFRQMAERIFAGLDLPARIVSVPGSMLVAVAHACRLLPGLRGVRPEMIRRENVDLVFDDSAARDVLGYRPRPFRPGPAEYALPDERRLRNLAAE